MISKMVLIMGCLSFRAVINFVPVTHRDTTGDGCSCDRWSQIQEAVQIIEGDAFNPYRLPMHFVCQLWPTNEVTKTAVLLVG